ncbi:MAG: SDR family oxidoreductase [Bacteroidota bacterium]|nr:SDR family oxidoreductase [Bacteroidota bacterium]
MQKSKPKKKVRPGIKQRKPGLEERMVPLPVDESELILPEKKFEGKTVFITGGDSGIGRAVAIAFAMQGANIAISFLPKEKSDALITKERVESFGVQCLLLPGNIGNEQHCKKIISETHRVFGSLDVLINNAGVHYPKKSITEISAKQLKETFEINIFSMFYLVKAALRYLREGSCIINTASVTAYRGSPHLLDYSATKGAIVSFTRSLSASLAQKKIRVNAVAPGPVWTPLIASSMPPKEIATFGSDAPIGRAAQPFEMASSYIFLASPESLFINGQVIHPNGGEIING